MAKPKCTQELIDKATGLKRHSLTNKDICQALCIVESTFYQWLSDDKNKLHRALKESLKKGGGRVQGRALGVHLDHGHV